MLRLTLILCAGLYAALMIAGEDRGQLRPGLADAAARLAATGGDTVAESAAPIRPEEAVTVVSAAPVTKPPAPSTPAPSPTVASAAAEPVAPQPAVAPQPYIEPVRQLVTRVEEPVFSLASLGTEPVPGETAAEPVPEVAEGGEGTIWYVVANSVNVRAEPSTDAEVLGKLGSGEAALLVQAVNKDWARIVIQGDGVEGFVAMRYLSPEAP